MLRFRNVNLKQISDVEKYQFSKSIIICGISMISKDYIEGNKKIFKSYEANRPTSFIIAAPQGDFIVAHVWEKLGRKNLTIVKGCHYSWFYVMTFSSFGKIETKNSNSDLCILIFLVLETTSPAAYRLSKH